MLIPSSSPRRAAAGAAAVAALIVVFCLCLLKKNPGTFFNDDYQISILPVFTDVARAWHEGHWPLLSPYSWACGNLAGEYQYGTFSVFVNLLVVAVWKFPLAFAQQAAALSITHLAVLGAGAYLLARERRLPGLLAAGVALIASLNGWNLGWSAIDWFGALAAHAWLPWCWWAFEVALRKGGRRKAEGGRRKAEGGRRKAEGGRRRAEGGRRKAEGGRRKAEGGRRKAEGGRRKMAGGAWFLLPVPFVYLLLAAGFPYTVVMLAVVTVFLAARTWFRSGGDWRRWSPLAAGWGLGLMLSAPAWLSLLAAMHGSGRATQGVGVGNVAWSVPVTALPALVLPDWTVRWADFANIPTPHASLELAGGFVPVAALLAAAVCLRGTLWRRLRWELGLVGVVGVLCLLPSPGLFRWSFRWLPLLHLALALAAGRALHLLASRTRGPGWRFLSNPGAWASGCAALAWAAMVVFHTQDARNPETTRLAPFTLGVAIVWAVVAALPGRRRPWTLGVAGLAVLAATGGTYRYMDTNPHLPIYPVPETLRAVAPLSPDRLYVSLYREADQYYRDWQTPPGFGTLVRMGSMGMYAGVRMINGYSPIMPRGAGTMLNIETHGNVPPPDGEDLLKEDAAGPGGLLDELGVDGLVITHDYKLATRPSAAKWERVLDVDEGSVYHRRAGLVSDIREVEAPAAGEEARVHVLENSRQRVVADVEVPGGRRNAAVLSFRRPFFDGYHAALDGKPLAVSALDGLMPTVTLAPGSRGRLTLWFLPRAVVWGAILAAVGLVATGALAWRGRVRAG